MNSVLTSALRGDSQLRFSTNLHTAPKPKTRVAVFGSFHGGFHVLRQLLREPLAHQVIVTGALPPWAGKCQRVIDDTGADSRAISGGF